VTEAAQCPRCGSDRIWKAGRDAKGKQLLLCRDCLRRFHVKGNVTPESLEGFEAIDEVPNGIVSCSTKKSLDQLSFMLSKDVGSHKLSSVANSLNTLPFYNRELGTEMSTQRTTTTFQDRTSEQTLKGELVTFTFHSRKLNLAMVTTYNRARCIENLYRNGANLNNPDSILTVLALNEKWSDSYKCNLLQSYKAFAKWKKISLQDVELPKYRSKETQPYVPKETLLDQLIASSGWKTSAFQQVLKETGARTIEAASLQWVDVDATSHIITIRNPAKGGMPRQIHVSERCIQMLGRLPHQSDYIFGKNPKSIAERTRINFYWARAHTVAKTGNKDLLRIHLHTFRHFYATKLYLQTRDIRYVQKKMGHKSIASTIIYENSEPNQDVETFTVKAVTTKEEAEKLIALGYEFHYRTADGVDLFRKKVTGFD